MKNEFENIEVIDFLENLGIKNIQDGVDEVVFSCPFTQRHKNGDRNPSSSMNKVSRLIFCHGCKTGHNPTTFLAELEDIPRTLADRYIKERYGGIDHDGMSMAQMFKRKLNPSVKETIEETTNISTPKNKAIPWAFAEQREEALLKEPEALSYLLNRGLTLDALTQFSLGYDKASDRIVIPVCDADGQLLGFKGRTFRPNAPEPRYLVIGDRTGNTWGFRTVNVQHEIFNLHNLSRGEKVIIVEGEFDAIKIHEYGRPNVCALYGSTFTTEQKEKLLNVTNEFILFLDSDLAGEKCKQKIINQLGASCIIRVVEDHEGDPSDMTKEECLNLIDNAQSPYKSKLMQKVN